MPKKMFRILMLVIGIVSFGAVIHAQDMTPNVIVSDQFVYDDTVTIASVVSEDVGFIVIHADNGEGQPGPVIGFRSVSAGENTNVVVPLDVVNMTPTLFAMLHSDTGEVGVYEFGTVEGADAPVAVDDLVIAPPFAVEAISISDQIVGDMNTVTASTTVTSVDGWLVIHADNGDGSPGAVLGQTFVPAGINADVMVTLEGDATQTLYPMLHVDTGEAEVYEFGTVEGADTPVQAGGRTAVTSILTVPTIRVSDQIIMGSDATTSEAETTTLHLDGVLSDGNGWLVVHAADENGNPGAVIGYGAIADGYNENVVVELPTADVTPVVFPMLHEDTGEAQVYEFGEVEGADAPVSVDGQVVVVPVNVAPRISFEGELRNNMLTVESALIDGPGWLVIHADDGNGAPGAVIGFAPLLPGVNNNVMVELDMSGLTGTLYPMLHYDNNIPGEYEFGSVDGADGPVVVNGNVATGPLNPAIMD